MPTWSFVPKIRPLFSAVLYYNDADQETATAAPRPTITFEFKFNVTKIEIAAERRRIVRRTKEDVLVVRDLGHFLARQQSRAEFIRELEADAPLIGALPKFARDYIKQQFPRFVCGVVARSASEPRLEDLRVLVNVTEKTYSSVFCCDRCPICFDEFRARGVAVRRLQTAPLRPRLSPELRRRMAVEEPDLPTCRQPTSKPRGFDK
uniref:Uncharacterized protein n=1 Tax=Ananas comosus var. bracteatus TaxID=296719 RepID=A0A6V7PW06_ANACO|nr:unnamed protein product [Ananas comosus var. bracteatus]